jgi:hypothetical protein
VVGAAAGICGEVVVAAGPELEPVDVDAGVAKVRVIEDCDAARAAALKFVRSVLEL